MWDLRCFRIMEAKRADGDDKVVLWSFVFSACFEVRHLLRFLECAPSGPSFVSQNPSDRDSAGNSLCLMILSCTKSYEEAAAELWKGPILIWAFGPLLMMVYIDSDCSLLRGFFSFRLETDWLFDHLITITLCCTKKYKVMKVLLLILFCSQSRA